MVRMLAHKNSAVLIVVLLVASVSLSGCETLRKKFTRHKKQDQSESRDFEPVLEPEDYPSPQANPAANYRQHYLLIKAWYKDLWTAVEEKDTSKRVRYVIKQIYGHIEEMQKLVAPPKQDELSRLKGLLQYYDQSLDSPAPMRNVSRIQSDLRAFDRQLRALNPSKLQGNFVTAAK